MPELTYPYPENELFRRIAAGDTDAFTLIFKQYSTELAPFVTRLTGSPELAKEVMQDIFLKLWLQRERLTTVKQPRAWIVRLASNTAVDYLRKQAADGRLLKTLEQQTAWVETPDMTYAGREAARQLEQAIEHLTPAQQRVYRMSREQHLSIQEIAQELGVSPNTVKNQLVDALKTIRKHLDKGIYIVLFAHWL